jgi:hypothetical protein
LQERLQTFVSGDDGETEFQATLELAQIVRELAHRGPGQLQLCRAVMRVLADYIHERDQATSAEVAAW